MCRFQAHTLGCDVKDVMADDREIPIGNDTPPQLTELSMDILHSVFAKLELYDVSCCICVCRKWRSAGISYLKGLKKAEHALSAHLLRNKGWAKLRGDMSGKRALREWKQVGIQLISWTINISTRLESIILQCPIDRAALNDLMDSCPSLKNVLFGIRASDFAVQFDTSEIWIAFSELGSL